MMELTQTVAGREAYRLVDWAAQDPPGRADEARSQIAALQLRETDPAARREIADAAKMALRL